MLQFRPDLKRSALVYHPGAKSRSRIVCRSQYQKSTGQAANPAEPPGQDKSHAVPSASAAKQAKQSWSTFPAVGVASWQQDSASETLGPGKAIGSHMYANSRCWGLHVDADCLLQHVSQYVAWQGLQAREPGNECEFCIMLKFFEPRLSRIHAVNPPISWPTE